MLARLALAAAIVAAVIALVTVVRWWTGRRDSRVRNAPAEALWEALSATPDGRPAVVAFSSPGCVSCRTTQAPAIEALSGALQPSSFRVIKVDVAEEPAAASAFGILTVPSTVVLSREGHVAAINHGFATTAKLAGQILSASSSSPAAAPTL